MKRAMDRGSWVVWLGPSETGYRQRVVGRVVEISSDRRRARLRVWWGQGASEVRWVDGRDVLPATGGEREAAQAWERWERGLVRLELSAWQLERVRELVQGDYELAVSEVTTLQERVAREPRAAATWSELEQREAEEVALRDLVVRLNR
jgi:hypothetical protein